MDLSSIINKLMSVFQTVIEGIASLSYVAFIAMLCVSGALFLFGNEAGAKITLKRAAYGYFIIQIANLLL